MNILLFGQDCGTQALAWKVFNSSLVDELICSPGNGGTSLFTPSATVPPGDLGAVSRFVLGEEIDLVIADEAAITAGVADEAQALHTPVFGSGKAAAAVLESRCAQHEWLLKHDLPAPMGRAFERADQAEKFAATLPLPVAIRADSPSGPSALCSSRADLRAGIERCLNNGASPHPERGILVHTWSPGPLVSASVLTDGQTDYTVPAARLHQPDGEPWRPVVAAHRGITPLWDRLDERLQALVRAPLSAAWKGDELPVRGWVGANCRLAAGGPVIDSLRLAPEPLEAALLLPLLEGDAVPLLRAAASRSMALAEAPTWRREAGVAVLRFAQGWPEGFSSGQRVEGLADLEPGVLVFQGSTENRLGLTYIPRVERYASRHGSVWSVLSDGLLGTRDRGEGIVTTGGAILAVVEHAPDLAAASARVYRNLDRIHIAGSTFLRAVAEREL